MDSKTSNTLLMVGLLAVGAYFLYTLSGGSLGGCDMQFCANWLAMGATYVPTLNQIESQYGLPTNLLCAVAYAESSFNPAAKNCSSGATGMFQLLPTYYPNAGQSWQTDAGTAAGALSDYYKEFGDWQSALAAYNWGPGSLQSSDATSISQLPTETQNYLKKIVAAVPVSGPFIGSTTMVASTGTSTDSSPGQQSAGCCDFPQMTCGSSSWCCS